MEKKFYRPTWAEIDLGAVKYNFNLVRKIVGKNTKILVAVKANAYGHGVLEVSKTLRSLGVNYLGVATVDEGIYLRRHGIKLPVLVLGSVLKYELRAAILNNLTLTVCDSTILKAIDAAAKAAKKKVRVHAKIDTGMGRIGVWHEEAEHFIKDIVKYGNLELEGIYTHFPSADEEDKTFTMRQIRNFEGLVDDLEKEGIKIPLVHAANSMGLMGYKDSHFNLVRPGIMIYGLYSDNKVRRHKVLRPAMSLKTKIVYLKHVPKGRSVSYGRTHYTKTDTLIATLPVGYADGYSRLLSNKAQVIIRGKKAPVVGIVCMDQTMVDVGHINGVKVGDEVILIGKSGKENISAEELAQMCGTISYEIVTGISSRVPRVHHS